MTTRPASIADTVMPGAPAEDHVLDETGHLHATDAPVDLSHYTFEAWIAFGFFWLLAATVFYQFFTRYALNNSASWTEEIARYLLIATVFIGIAAAVRTTRHIHVDFLYRLVPRRVGRVLATLVDAIKVAFFGYATVLTWQMMDKMSNYKMTIIDLPMNYVYGVCMVGFAFCTLRAVQVAVENWRRGYTHLERPEAFMEASL
ncbi:MAG TPA: TRAP transporter small permease [Casimicrobiaceae bacterium]|jgi:TRAP-type C4-dicarboxylate transport system permease small subunit